MAKAVLSRLGTATNLAIRNSTTMQLRNSIRRHSAQASSTKFEHLSFTEKDLVEEERLKSLFERWRHHYNEGLDWDDDEKEKRFAVFKENAKLIREVNFSNEPGKHTNTLGLNNFAAMTPEETWGFTGYGRPRLRERGGPIQPGGTDSELVDRGDAADGGEHRHISPPHQVAW